jgi:hypothetical protein
MRQAQRGSTLSRDANFSTSQQAIGRERLAAALQGLGALPPVPRNRVLHVPFRPG